MSDKLMDTAPGGETSQYESIKTVTNPTQTQVGQFQDKHDSDSSKQQQQQKQEKGEENAEKIRYGQNISESGFGGETTNNEGVATQGGFGGTPAQKGEEEPSQTRREQGYGKGSGVGA